MDPHVVVSCPVTVFSRSALGHETPIGDRSQLTVNYVEGCGHPQTIIVYDENRLERLKILVATEVARFKIVNRFNHEIIRYEDTTIVLLYYQEDKVDVRAFANCMENVFKFKRLHRFASTVQAIDPSSSWSDDDDDTNNGAVMTARPATSIVTFWECANCHFESADEHSWECEECGRPRVINRDLEWQCCCHRVYDNRISKCSQCGTWRCQSCTFQNGSTSLHCHSCQATRSE